MFEVFKFTQGYPAIQIFPTMHMVKTSLIVIVFYVCVMAAFCRAGNTHTYFRSNR